MRKRLVIASSLTVLAIAAGVAWTSFRGVIVEQQTRNLETEVIRIELAGQKFNVPMRYMYGQAIEKYRQWPKAKPGRVDVGALSLSVLLPALRPYYPEDDARWKVLGHGDRLEVSIMKPVGGGNWYVPLRDRYLQGKEPGQLTREVDAMGLMHFSRSSTDDYFPSEASHELAMTCDSPDGRRGRKGLPFPSCRVKSNYRPGIVLEYYYGLEHLPRWQEIDNDLKAMFDQFARVAASESQSQTEQ